MAHTLISMSELIRAPEFGSKNLQIPADMVVNAMIVAMVAHANEPNPYESIYHIATSVSNPLEFTYVQDYGLRYFTEHPWIGKDGKPVIVGKVTVLSTMASFQRYMMIRYFLPLKVPSILTSYSSNSFLIFFSFFC